jgi:glucose/mannose-6-phosphate isomerase
MTVALDDLAVLRRYDSAGMLAEIAGLPDQLRDGWQRTRRLALAQRHREATAVAVLGMGGSAVAADICRGVFGDRLRVPVVSVRDYELPAWVGPRTLVVGSSFSGGTEETIAALTTALERRCPVAIITTGGPLLDVARRAELPFLDFPGGGQPRAAIGYAIVLLTGLLERAGFIDGGETLEREVEAAAAATSVTAERCDPAIPTEQNPAKELAWSLVDRMPVIEASGFLSAVARRWKTQMNENGKTMAVAEELPEATHNAVVGYAQPEALHERLFYVFLASPSDHPRNRLRAALSTELLAGSRIPHQVVPVAGEGRLAQACSSVCLGDFASVYLAVLYGLDPTPVEVISRIKERLAEASDPDD